MRAAWCDPLFVNYADHTALSSFTSEAGLLQGTNRQPTLPANYFSSVGVAVRLTAAGELSTTGTPTWIFQVRLHTTQGATELGGVSVGVSPTITSQSGVTDVSWYLDLMLRCTTPGQGGTNGTLVCSGKVVSFAGFAAPYGYALHPSTPPTATWTAGINTVVQQYITLSVTCGTSSGSNNITCKEVLLEGVN